MSLLHAGIYHLIQRARGEPVAQILKELRDSQWWSPDRLRSLQLRKLQKVMSAAAQAPHYRSSWPTETTSSGRLPQASDLARLPLLEKEHLRESPDAVRVPGDHGPLNVHVTTGSSGVPLRVFRSRRASAVGRACQIRGREWYGLRLGDPQVLFGGLALESQGRARARLIDTLMNRTRLSPFDLSEDRLADCVTLIRKKRPRFLYGYPSALAMLAAHVERIGGGGQLGLRVVQSSSERLYQHRREVIQRAFQCPVADEYGAAEVSILAMECPSGSMHVVSENVYIEITDEAGRPVPEGQDGDVVVTDLNNLAAPLVRYRLGDRARMVPGACLCGRGLPRIEVLEGSAFGLLQLPDGRTVSGVVFYFLAESLIMKPDAGLREIILIRKGNHFEANAVPRAGGNPRHAEELRRRLAEILGPGASVDVKLVNRIDRRGGDKYRILFDEEP